MGFSGGLLAKFAPVLTTVDQIGLSWFLQVSNILVGVPLGIVALGIVLLVPGAAESLLTAPRSRKPTESTP